MTMFPTLFAKMSRLRHRLRGAPAISPAELEDAPSLAALHGEAFGRGWSTEEFERLLVEHNVVADRATAGSRLVGFVVSRIAADEAEILSIAVAPDFRGAGLARRLLANGCGCKSILERAGATADGSRRKLFTVFDDSGGYRDRRQRLQLSLCFHAHLAVEA